MILDKLYKRTKKGQVQSWQIEVEGDKYRTHEGIEGGVITCSEWTICQPSNVGRSNEKSAEQQAEFEAKAKWTKKRDKDYVQFLEDIDVERHFEPMLAFKYEDYKDTITFPCYVQPKLDGIRCNPKQSGLWSRNGKPIVATPHIYEELKPFFDQFPGIIFDGELYNHDLKDNFDQIVSCVRKTKLSEKEFEESRKFVQYHIYDIFDTSDFEDRNEFLQSIALDFSKHIKIVPTYKVNSFEEIDQYYEKFLEMGFEGIMIRKNASYENKRSKNLLKRKEHIDEEFEILDICEGVGNRSGMAGYLVCKLKDGRTFNSNIKGGFEFYRELWKNTEQYIGQQATIRFQNWTPDKMPRFPRCIAIRNYE